MSKSNLKRSSITSKILCAAVVAAPVVLTTSWFSGQANAADLSWDSTSAGSASGGTGTWDVGNTWWNGTTTTDQAWADSNNAIFAGNAGTVTINGSVAPSNMDFQTDGYLIQGGNLAATSVSVDAVGMSAEIDSAINGTGALTMNGPGTLVVGGALANNTYSGGTNFNGGVLEASTDAALGGSSTNLTFNGGTLKWGAAFDLDLNRTIQLDGDGIFDTNGFGSNFNGLIQGSGTFIKSGGGNYVYGTSGAAWNGKLVVRGGRWAATSVAALPHVSTNTPDAITIDGGEFWGDTGNSDSTDPNLGMYVTNNGGTTLMGLNTQTLTWTGSLSSQSSAATLGVNYGTIRFAGDVSGYNGTLAVNVGGNGQGRIIIDNTLPGNNGMKFTWNTNGVAPPGSGGQYDGGEIIINSNNPNWTGGFSSVVNNAGILAAGPGTTQAFGDSTNTITADNGWIGGGNGAVIPQNINFTNGMSVLGMTGAPNPGTEINPEPAPTSLGDTVTFTGLITGTGDFSKGNPRNPENMPGLFTTVVLAHSGNSWTGDTNVYGQLDLAANDALPTGTHVLVGGGNGKQLTLLPGISQTVGSITSTGWVNLNSGSTLTFGADNTDCDIEWLSGNGKLVKTGTGTFEITDSDSANATYYSGPIEIQGGTLLINPSGGQAPMLGDSSATNTLTLNGGAIEVEDDLDHSSPAPYRSLIVASGGGTLDPGHHHVDLSSLTGTGNLLVQQRSDFDYNYRGLHLISANTGFSGGITISGAQVNLGNNNAAGDGSATNTITFAAAPSGSSRPSVLASETSTLAIPQNIIVDSGATGVFSARSSSNVTVNGTISGDGTATLDIGTPVVIAGNVDSDQITANLAADNSSTYSGAINVLNRATLLVTNSNNLGDGSATNSVGLDSGGTLQTNAAVVGTQSLIAGDNANSTGGNTGGTLNSNGFNSSWGNLKGSANNSGSFTKTGAGVVSVRSINLNSLNVSAGTVQVQDRATTGGNQTTYVNSLSIDPSAALDLNDNDLVVTNGDFSTIQALVLSGHASTPTPGKTGIISTVSQNTGGKTILELVDNSLVGYAVWPVASGHAVDTNAIIGKYTYYGDTNLDGAVTGDDYSAVDANLGSTPPAGKAILLGDTNFDGHVTGDDYSFIDADLGLGVGNQLAVSHLSAVPEPTSLGLLALGGVGVLMRRRRRSRENA